MFSKWIISLTKIILCFQYFRFLYICNLFPILFFLKKMSCFYPPFLKFIKNIFYSLIENCHRKVLNIRLNLDFRQTFFPSWATCCFINSIKTADGTFCAVLFPALCWPAPSQASVQWRWLCETSCWCGPGKRTRSLFIPGLGNLGSTLLLILPWMVCVTLGRPLKMSCSLFTQQ